MSAFPLIGLPSTSLERIITKLEQKSYARLQQTCHSMAEFVRTARNVTVCVNKRASLEWKKDENEASCGFLYVYIYDPAGREYVYDWSDNIDVEGFYGARFASICTISGIEMGFELFCSLLKKYRITCKNLDVNCFDDKNGPSKEQCAGLLKNLKPNIVSLRSEGSNRFKAVSAWKGLKRAVIRVSPDDALSALQVASSCSSLFISVEGTVAFAAGRFYSVFERILQLLHSGYTYMPNLCRFSIDMTCDEDLPPLDKLTLSGFQPTLLSEKESYARLQQTCHAMANFFQTNKNVRFMYEEKFLILDWEPSLNSMSIKVDHCIHHVNTRVHTPVELESLYGSRFERIDIRSEMSEKFEQLIDILKTYHISCKTLDMNTRWAGKGPTKEQCVEVFKLIKPEGINLDSKDSDRFEALATYKATKDIYTNVVPSQDLSSLSLLSQFPTIAINIEKKTKTSVGIDQHELFHLLADILKSVCSRSFPNLHSLEIFFTCDEVLPPVEEQLQRLHDLHPAVVELKKDWNTYQISGCHGHSFRVLTQKTEATILFGELSWYMVLSL